MSENTPTYEELRMGRRHGATLIVAALLADLDYKNSTPTEQIVRDALYIMDEITLQAFEPSRHPAMIPFEPTA